jgi:hypothetical protein
MAYEDLYSDAAIFYNLNNNFTPVVNTTVAPQAAIRDGLTGTGENRQYYADVPPGSPYTHSLKINGNSTAPRTKRLKLGPSQEYTNNYGLPSFGETINFWYKTVATTDSVHLGQNFTFFRRENGTTDEIMPFLGGTNYIDSGSNVGKLTWTGMRYVTSASSATTWSANTGYTFQMVPDTWYNITFTWVTHKVNTNLNGSFNIERAIYVNGIPVHNSFIEGVNGFSQGDDLEAFFTTNQAINVQIMSSLAAWNRALTREEIKALAVNNYSISDISTYNNHVINNGVQYYTTLNNPDKNTDADAFGTSASWGALNDGYDQIEVNQESKFGKSWKFTTQNGTLIQEVDIGTTDMKQGLKDTVVSGNFSFEFWIKNPISSNNQFRKLTVLYPQTAQSTATNGPVHIGTRGLGPNSNLVTSIWINVPALTTTWSWPLVSLDTAFTDTTTSGASNRYTTSSTLQQLYLHIYEGICNDDWHHVVVVKTPGGLSQSGSVSAYRIYIDGILRRTYNTNWNSAAFSTLPYGQFFMGEPSQLLNRSTDFFIDKIAVYDRACTIKEIQQRYLIGKSYLQSQANLVKYYDGTDWQTSSAQKVWDGVSWVDWNHKYWNGTAWIDL